MLINETSLFTQVFLNFTNNVFGTYFITCLMIFVLFFIIGLLIKIPLSVNLGLFIPLSIILMAIGFLPIVAGSIMIVVFMILAGVTFVNGF